MNTRSLAYLVAIGATGAAIPTVGLAQSEPSFAVFGSYWDADIDSTTGIGVKGRLGMLDLRATYYEDATGDDGVEVEAIPIEAGVAYNFAPHLPVNPYVGAGVSYHLLDSNEGSVDDEVGWYAVVGGEFGMTEGISFMGELMYRDVDATIEDRSDGFLVQDDVSVDLNGFAVNLGAAWRF